MPFKKGQSGNPSGRKKEDPELKALAKEYAVEVFDRLLFWLRSDNGKASIAAAGIILDRAYGKAAQPLEGDITGKLTLSWEE